MGCNSTKEIEDKKEEKVENNEKKEDKEEKENKEENDDEEDEENDDEKEYNYDKDTIDYFSNFEKKEISLIFSRRKKINQKNNFCFLYSKYDVIYNDKFLMKSDKILCTEFLACYINPDYIGNFGYESQIVGFFPKKVTLKQGFIKDDKINAKMINNGKIIIILQIKKEHKIDLMNDIMIFEFVYHIKQIKNYGMRLININLNEEFLTCSMKIKYDQDQFSIKSNGDLISPKQNEFNIYNKKKFCLTLIDNNNIISLDDNNMKFNNKFNSEEIQRINKSLINMDIKPLKPNLLYEKTKHEIHEEFDYIEGSLFILQPSFEKYYFNLFEIISTIQNDSIFKILELKINDKAIINLNKSEKYKKSDNYYKSSKKSYNYIISTKEDFILIEFQLEIEESKEEKKKIKYKFDPKNIFNISFSKGTYYFFEIILNGFKISFGEDKNYEYEENEGNIVFEGNWELDDDKESEGNLPKEIILKEK